jgi:hypothetical protein
MYYLGFRAALQKGDCNNRSFHYLCYSVITSVGATILNLCVLGGVALVYVMISLVVILLIPGARVFVETRAVLFVLFYFWCNCIFL